MKKDGVSFDKIVSVDNFIDLDGRPLGEHKACPIILENVPMKLKQCNYHDSRLKSNNPMNVSALKQLTVNWEESLSMINALKRKYEFYVKRDLITYEDSLRFGELIACIPSWLKYQGNGDISSISAANYKITIGVNRIIQVLLSGDLMAEADQRRIQYTASDIAKLADVGGFLIGAEQVCAGSKSQINQAIEAIMFKNNNSFTENHNEILATLFEDENNFFIFAESVFRLKCIEFLVRTYSVITLGKLQRAIYGNHFNAVKSAITRAMNHLDMNGTIQGFIDSRSSSQLEKLIYGWIKLSGVSDTSLLNNVKVKLKVPEELKLAPNVDELISTVEKELSLYLQLENKLLCVVEKEQKAINRALNRNEVTKTIEAKDIRKAFGPTLIDLIESEFKLNFE